MARELNGLEIQSFIKERQAHQVRGLKQHFHSPPTLAIIQTIDDPVTNVYTKLKQAYGEDIGVTTSIYKINQSELSNLIQKLNKDNAVKGIILQLPLNDPTQTNQMVNLINPQKDVDGLGVDSTWDAATPTAINWLLASYNIDLRDKKILIVGKGQLVGAPLFAMWQKSNLNVEAVDDSVVDLSEKTKQADVIVSATGSPELISADMIDGDTVIVDAGTANSNGSLIGDVGDDVRELKNVTITPKKGGVGPLTISALFDNVIRASYPN